MTDRDVVPFGKFAASSSKRSSPTFGYLVWPTAPAVHAPGSDRLDVTSFGRE